MVEPAESGAGRTALLIVDVQNDFTEGGALAVSGGAEVATRLSRLLIEAPERYDLVLASRDWHDAGSDNGGHFSAEPDFTDTWPVHCVAGSAGAEYHPALSTDHVDVHVHKGQGEPAYSLFEGSVAAVTPAGGSELLAAAGGEELIGLSPAALLERLGVQHVDVAGIATDHCVRASSLDALGAGLRVRVLTDLVAGVDGQASTNALEELRAAGAELHDETTA
ncbi:isochorismatase family protein [Sediminivirga luteola]|uniref:nicotinamidase n=1 Tax=Sediminivirga luteola TaxID=1774748 RepID=A0A8J2XM07_9MICO|nr:isochorismatase family protein [Sediminivirga luteola]MCI2265179.1 isochorismatase family protein [Sediminivirga luteola]GGA22299.1 nicotinamidase [Sediminivirga luteola]